MIARVLYLYCEAVNETADEIGRLLLETLEFCWMCRLLRFFCCSQELEFNGKKVIIIFVPVPQLRQYQKIQVRLIRELEKKFSGKHVVFVAQRRILPKPKPKVVSKYKQKRPYRLVELLFLFGTIVLDILSIGYFIVFVMLYSFGCATVIFIKSEFLLCGF